MDCTFCNTQLLPMEIFCCDKCRYEASEDMVFSEIVSGL